MLVRLKDKGQVTIPVDVRQQLAASTGDLFDVQVVEGAIVLRPATVSAQASPFAGVTPKGVDITRWIGAGRGLFGTREDVDAFIRAERAQWD
jgi:AbrB family looped-hinge helix DNA binding protein